MNVYQGTKARGRPATRVFLKERGAQGGWVVGAVGGTLPPAGDPELLEAPQAPEKIFDWLKIWRKICPIT